MAKTALSTIKSWFETGDFPTQNQFWNWLDSYWHKDEELPIGVISGLSEIIAGKATQEQVDTLEGLISDLLAKEDETIITQTGIINDLQIDSTFARFTGQGEIILTGIDATGITGKRIVIRNESGQSMAVKHLSDSSAAANRLYISGEVDLPLDDKGAATFYYSQVLDMWVLSDVFGNSFSPQYVGDVEQVVVTVGDGSTKKVKTVEIEQVRADLTADQSSADLNLLFPDAILLQKIWCPNLINGAGFYILLDDINGFWYLNGQVKV